MENKQNMNSDRNVNAIDTKDAQDVAQFVCHLMSMIIN